MRILLERTSRAHEGKAKVQEKTAKQDWQEKEPRGGNKGTALMSKSASYSSLRGFMIEAALLSLVNAPSCEGPPSSLQTSYFFLTSFLRTTSSPTKMPFPCIARSQHVEQHKHERASLTL